MTTRDRFMGTLLFQDVPVPNVEIALWQQTTERWLTEGMPADAGGVSMYGNPYYGLEGYDTLYLDAINPNPAVPYQELAEDEETVTFIDGMGRTRTALKTGTVHGQRMSMDTYLQFAVYDRESFQRFKQYYLGPVMDRYPADWREKAAALTVSDKPLTLLDPLSGTFGYYSMLRNWMGTEGVSYLLHDDPALIEECLEFLTEFALRVLTPAIESLTFDFYYIHEDMSYKNGPLVSPAMFKQFFVPHYERFIRFLKGHGIRVVMVDTDGNHDVLTPHFLDSGVDGFGPLERAADMDPVRVRREYPRAVMVGGVDKREIARDRAAIDAEVAYVAQILDQGGYIPTIDHSIPPDVSYDNFLYYLEVKRKALGLE